MSLRRRLPVIKGGIRRRMRVNFRAGPAAVQKLFPPAVRSVTPSWFSDPGRFPPGFPTLGPRPDHAGHSARMAGRPGL